MRELRKIKNKRFKKGRNGVGRWILFLLVVGVVAGIGIIFILSKEDTKLSPSDLTSGKIYMQENRQKHESGLPYGGKRSQSEKTKEEIPSNPESFTFYKVLNSKEKEIVPLTGDIPRSEKKGGNEIKDPQQEKMQQIEKEIDKGLEKRVKKDDVYTVQVAALSNESTANAIMSRLKSQGYLPYLFKGDEQKSVRLYKVRVGRFVSIVDAREVAKLLKRNGLDTYVVKAE